jgi:hypothetical protein
MGSPHLTDYCYLSFVLSKQSRIPSAAIPDEKPPRVTVENILRPLRTDGETTVKLASPGVGQHPGQQKQIRSYHEYFRGPVEGIKNAAHVQHQ